MGDVLIKAWTRNSGKVVYEYRFEVASIDGKRQWKSKSGFATKREAREAGKIAQQAYEHVGQVVEPLDINSLPEDEKIDGLSVMECMEKGEFDKIKFKRWEKKVYEVYFQKHNRIFYITVDKENIYLLHACRKQKNKTEKTDQKLVRKRASELGKQLGKTILSSQWYSINRLLKELRSESEECWKKFKQKYSFSQTPALLVFEKGKCASSVEWWKDGLPVEKLLNWLKMNDIV